MSKSQRFESVIEQEQGVESCLRVNFNMGMDGLETGYHGQNRPY